MSYMAEQDPAKIPEVQPFTFEEVLAELDAANGHLYLACARYADWPSGSRYMAVSQHLQTSNTFMKRTLELTFQGTTPEQAIRTCSGLLVTEDNNRVSRFQTILPAGSFAPLPKNIEEIIEDFGDIEELGYDNDDLAELFMSQHSVYMSNDFEDFFAAVNKSHRMRAVQTSEFLTRLAADGAKVGLAAGVSALVLKSFKDRSK